MVRCHSSESFPIISGQGRGDGLDADRIGMTLINTLFRKGVRGEV